MCSRPVVVGLMSVVSSATSPVLAPGRHPAHSAPSLMSPAPRRMVLGHMATSEVFSPWLTGFKAGHHGGRAWRKKSHHVIPRKQMRRGETRENNWASCGYGHTVPLSDGGKAFCIIYSVIGIPFTLLFLTAVVQRITVHVTRRPVLYFHIRWGFSKQMVAIVHAVVLGFVTVSCFFFIPAAVFSVLEDDWNFLESFYFCFISLSTIGLGDYVPGEGYNQKFRELYKIGITCYLLLGLIAMLVVLETFCELHELKKFRKMFYVKKDKDEDQVHIVEHDQLSFSSITDQAASVKEEQKQSEPFVAAQVSAYAEDSASH
ncbi:potassium channel subfamily K member 1 isoform X1 [Cavia porcellus]|uniref:potassium channel subfamily K member 1 isoform X1 n=1 Tax=Cavia porcellus TaxID=10141 RepID=UPI002FE1044A